MANNNVARSESMKKFTYPTNVASLVSLFSRPDDYPTQLKIYNGDTKANEDFPKLIIYDGDIRILLESDGKYFDWINGLMVTSFYVSTGEPNALVIETTEDLANLKSAINR